MKSNINEKKFLWRKNKLFRKKKKLKFFELKKFLFIFPLLIIWALIYRRIFSIKRNYPNKKYLSQEKIDESTLNESMYNAAERAKNFYNNANKGILTKEIRGKVDFPKMSIVIPMCSIEDTIKRAVRSVQNQIFYDFEIILIDDFSTDNTLKIVEEMSKEDPRIKIVKNQKNLGLLHTRCIGTLLSKGQYILPLDGDDLFLNCDTLSLLNQEIDKLNVDIIKFRAIETFNVHNPLSKYSMKLIPNDITNITVLHQPDIGIFGEKRCIIWEQCINAEFLKNAINLYGRERMSRYANYLEDCLIHFILYQTAKSLKLFLKIGILRIRRGVSATTSVKQVDLNRYYIYLYEVYFEFAQYVSWTRDSLIKNVIGLLNRNDFQETLNNTEAKNEIKDIVKKIIFNKNITNENKEALINTSLQIKLFENKNLF